ncbi:MAG TPA: DUF3828 domain-containing protein [Candidatus Aquabacterium excrementipullorum]|nr:DUF3828 domain-containing protein [Candidatus Aquabacterium excrementipullorum]
MMFHVRRWCCLAFWCLALQAGHCAEAAPEAPVRVIYQLYKDFAWVPMFAAGKEVDAYVGPGLMEQPRAVLERYFDPSLVDLIVAETKCVADNPGTLCNLEFDPLFGSSDPGAGNLRIKAGANNTALVQFDYPSSGEKVRLEYTLVQKDGHWKVRDIAYVKARSKVTLRTILSRK